MYAVSVLVLQDYKIYLMCVIAFLIKMVLLLIIINLSVCSFSQNHFTSRMYLYVVRLCNETLNFSKKVKYLGVYLTNALTDDDDINRQVRFLYCSANQLKSAFSQCSFDIKNLLFKSYCTNFYGSHLWSKYLKSSVHSICVAYKDC